MRLIALKYLSICIYTKIVYKEIAIVQNTNDVFLYKFIQKYQSKSTITP